MSQTKIEPCPNCGGQARPRDDLKFGGTGTWITCDHCNMTGPLLTTGAVSAWNRISRIVGAHGELVGACQTVISVIECLEVEADPTAMYCLGKPTLDKLRKALALADAIEKEKP